MTAPTEQVAEPASLPFRPFVRAGDFVFVSGQAAVDEAGLLVPGTFEEQMRRSMENVRRVLAEAGLTSATWCAPAATCTTPPTPPSSTGCTRVLPPPLPARTTLTGCLTDEIRFEIDVVAYAGGGEG